MFKGTSKAVQNELLELCLKLCSAQFRKRQSKLIVAVISDDTTDVSNHFQSVVFFRYIVSGKVVERLWSFLDLPQGNATNVTSCVNSILPGAHDKQKLVAQCYDSASSHEWPA